jgi:hypothetical protein
MSQARSSAGSSSSTATSADAPVSTYFRRMEFLESQTSESSSRSYSKSPVDFASTQDEFERMEAEISEGGTSLIALNDGVCGAASVSKSIRVKKKPATDGKSRTDLSIWDKLPYFKKPEAGEVKHTCLHPGCKKQITCYTPRRNLFQSLSEHYKVAHPEGFSIVMESKLQKPTTTTGSDTDRRVSSYSPLQALSLTREQKMMFGLFANAAARDGLAQCAGENSGLRLFFNYAGIPLKFNHTTIRCYQEVLRKEYLSSVSKKIQLVRKFSHNQNVFSLSVDVWSRDGNQLVGLVTYIDPQNTTPPAVYLNV